MVYAAVLGYGTVGSGVVQILEENKDIIAKRAGEEIKVKYVLDLRDFEGQKVQELIVHDFNIILNDDEVKVVAEAMGGVEPAYSFVKAALEKGKSVTTSNKELVARYGAELIKTAKENSVNFLFEASVGGGIPIMRPLNECLTADDILEITGILNGTTNYMLTKMTEEGLEYDDILKDAQDKGYAERNPANDVEGYDTCRKIAILTSMATGKLVNFEDIYTEGITNISKTDIEYVKKMGKSIKLLAVAKKTDKGVWARVSPAIIGKENPLSMVNDVFNAILVKGNMVDDVMFYGKGAGKLPTASAVVGDIVDAVKNFGRSIIIGWTDEKLETLDIDSVQVSKLIRIEYNNKEEALKAVNSVFPGAEIIELESIGDELAFVCERESEAAINEKTNTLINNGAVENVLSSIRIED